MEKPTVTVEPEPFECVPHGLLLDRQISANTLRVYLILRKHRDYDTGRAWPGLSRVGDLIGISSRTVQRCISELVTAGYVCVSARFNEHGGRTSNAYHIHYDKTENCRHFTDPNDTDVVTPTTPMSPTPTTPMSAELRPIDIQDPTNQVDTPHPFDEFWTAYPRKDGKVNARKAFTKAAGKVSAWFLVAAAVQYRQWCERTQQPKQFIPHASTWLNGERWEDERAEPENHDRMDAHIAHIQELWENGPVENPRNQLEG